MPGRYPPPRLSGIFRLPAVISKNALRLVVNKDHFVGVNKIRYWITSAQAQGLELITPKIHADLTRSWAAWTNVSMPFVAVQTILYWQL